MRTLGLIPLTLFFISLILSFLCLFAGSQPGLMEEYSILTLNTSRLGETLLSASHHSSNPFLGEIDNITDSIENELDQDLNDLARDLGLHDFYSFHVLDYCEGYYDPGPVPNATLLRSSIHKNVTHCSSTTAFYHFDPQATLQKQLNNSGHSNIDLSDLHWPHEISDGLHALNIVQGGVYVLYCISIGFIFVALVLSAAGLFTDGCASAFVNFLVDCLAFFFSALASTFASVIAVKATHLINHYGNDVGVSAQQGNNFMAMTWATTVLIFISSIVWCFEGAKAWRHDRYHTFWSKSEEDRYAGEMASLP